MQETGAKGNIILYQEAWEAAMSLCPAILACSHMKLVAFMPVLIKLQCHLLLFHVVFCCYLSHASVV